MSNPVGRLDRDTEVRAGSMPAEEHALTGLKILDFGQSAAGPMATKCLADFGATVVKIESHRFTDLARLSGPYTSNIAGPNRSGTFANFNSSKYSLTLNLKHPKGIEVVKRLARWADVTVENFRPGVMESLGLGFAELSLENEQLIGLSLGLQGQTGPFARMPGFGWNLNAFAGFSYLSGWPDREPAAPGVAYPDVLAPWFGVIAILAALEHRDRTGKGQYIDLSQLEASLQFLAPAILDYTANQRVQVRQGNRSPYVAPHGVYKALGEEEWCALAVLDESEWRRLCELMGRPHLATDSRFHSLAARKSHEDELDEIVGAWTATLAAADVMEKLQSVGIAAGRVQNSRDLLDDDPQLESRGYFQLREGPELGAFHYSGWPARLSATPWEIRMPAPMIGEHTAFVCSEILGMPDDEFVALLSEGVFE